MLTSYEFVSAWLQARCKTDRGASLVEYALLVALIAVVCILAVTFLGRNASSKFSSVGSAVGCPVGASVVGAWVAVESCVVVWVVGCGALVRVGPLETRSVIGRPTTTSPVGLMAMTRPELTSLLDSSTVVVFGKPSSRSRAWAASTVMPRNSAESRVTTDGLVVSVGEGLPEPPNRPDCATK